MNQLDVGLVMVLLGLLFIAIALIVLIWDKLRYRQYDALVKGKVIEQKWKHYQQSSYPYAIVEYEVDGQIYRVKQKYRSIYYNSTKHAKEDWMIDDNYCLHKYVTRKCEKHVDPNVEWFPIGKTMDVHYSSKKPKKAYCGALPGMTLMSIVLTGMGILWLLIGMLLMFVLKP